MDPTPRGTRNMATLMTPIRLIRLLPGMAFLLAPLAGAQEAATAPAPVVAPQEAAITLVGRKGEPIAIVDRRTGEVATDEDAERFVNRMSAEGLLRQAQRAEAAAEAEAAEAKTAEAEDAAAASAAQKAAEEAAEAKAAAEKAASEMRAKGWQPWTPDGEVLFNPNTFQFQPREKIVEEFLPPEPAKAP
jgi:hypothetical protein